MTTPQKNTTDMLALLRPALQAEVVHILGSIYAEDLTTDEIVALAGILRPAYARVQAGERQSAVVLKLVQPRPRSTVCATNLPIA